MKVVDIVPRQICIKLEIPDAECAAILDFFEKAIPLYVKVHFDSSIDTSLTVAEQFKAELASVMKTIKKETGDGS